MAHRTMIDGTSYEVTGGKTLIDGTAYSIKSGKTLVGGTAYEVGFGPAMCRLVFPNGLRSSSYSQNTGVNFEYFDWDTTEYEVPAGTVITVYFDVYKDSDISTLTINGTVVWNSFFSPGWHEYSYTVTKDTTVTITATTITIAEE